MIFILFGMNVPKKIPKKSQQLASGKTYVQFAIEHGIDGS